jgi:hypothetical protein
MAVVGVVAMVVIGGNVWDAANPPDPPDMRKREVVRERLSQVDGLRPVLPVTLPLGYSYAREYDYDTVDEASVATDEAAVDETTERSAAWSISFFPEDGASEDGLPVVVFCVQRPGSKDVICPERADATHLRRQLGQTTVAIYRASPGRQDMAAWKAVDLTTDIDRVTWLR